jgi:hypothetical protein
MKLRALVLPLLVLGFTLISVRAHASNGDMVQFGSDIEVSGDHSVHDAVCILCSVHIDGEASGDVVSILGGVHINGKADRDVVNILGRTRLSDGAIVGRDLVNILGSVRAGENVQVGHDLVVVLGSLRAPGSLSVGHDRVVQPGWLLWIPFAILALIVWAIVSAVRAAQHRRMYMAYPPPPPPQA